MIRFVRLFIRPPGEYLPSTSDDRARHMVRSEHAAGSSTATGLSSPSHTLPRSPGRRVGHIQVLTLSSGVAAPAVLHRRIPACCINFPAESSQTQPENTVPVELLSDVLVF